MDGRQEKTKLRIVGLDLFRIMSILIIFFFHQKIHLGINFGVLNAFISMGPIFMTAFFMLSGYVLEMTHGEQDICRQGKILDFYKKRFISIVPSYWLVAISYTIYLIIKGQSIGLHITMLPIELIGAQSWFNSLFSFSHNGGTWFISCLLICYFAYPLISMIIHEMKKMGKIIVLLIILYIILAAPLIVNDFQISSIYSNPLFRLLEFMLGILLYSLYKELSGQRKAVFERDLRVIKKQQKREMRKRNTYEINVYQQNMHIYRYIITIVILMLLLIAEVSVLVKQKIGVNDYMMYNWIAVPIFIIILLVSTGLKSSSFSQGTVKAITYMSNCVYIFFLVQFFTWPLTRWVLNLVMEEVQSSWIKFIISLTINSVLTVIIYELFDKPVRKLLQLIMWRK